MLLLQSNAAASHPADRWRKTIKQPTGDARRLLWLNLTDSDDLRRLGFDQGNIATQAFSERTVDLPLFRAANENGMERSAGVQGLGFQFKFRGVLGLALLTRAHYPTKAFTQAT